MKIEFHNLYTHFIFTTLRRTPLIPEENRERVEKYITGIVTKNKCKLYSIFVNPDHMHFLVSRPPFITEEMLATIVANCSERFININKLSNINFQWQQSASAFTVSKGDVDKVCKYILNQKEHHKKITFKEEYESFINFYLNKSAKSI
jgi:REP element-mobilizing transposase RayT